MKINRKNDYAFKRIFGHEDTKDILADFLTAVLSVPVSPEEITLINTEMSPDYLEDKPSALDIRIRRSAFHEKMNVEMQRADEGNIERRILFYWGRSYTEELKEGGDYASLPRQINIVITDFDVFDWKDGAKFHSVFRVLERDEAVLFSDALEIHFLELPKLRRQPLRENWKDDECWGLYLDNLEGDAMQHIAESKPLIKRAMTVEDLFTKNEEERYLYEQREKGRHDYINAMNTAERRGEARGRKKNAMEIAVKMLERGLSPEAVAEFLGLSVEEIKSLKN
jgi:predicted transposase/invertase (TIGR01784 family)